MQGRGGEEREEMGREEKGRRKGGGRNANCRFLPNLSSDNLRGRAQGPALR